MEKIQPRFPLASLLATFATLMMGLLTLFSVKASSECVARAKCEGRSDLLGPGSYEVVFVATHGSKAGRSTTGKLVLRTSTPDDTSPRTGETVAEDKHHRLYGSIEFNFGDIGAPIRIGDTVAPAPNSTDPVYPEVLVHEDMKASAGAVLTIGTVSNLRDDLRTGVLWTDGPGIALFVQCLTPTEFFGTWGAWGRMGVGISVLDGRASISCRTLLFSISEEWLDRWG